MIISFQGVRLSGGGGRGGDGRRCVGAFLYRFFFNFFLIFLNLYDSSVVKGKAKTS